MENKDKNIDNLFKDGLGNYSELPPPAVWDRLEKKLDGIQTKKPGQYYRWLGYFGMVSLLLLLGVSVTSNLTGIRLYHSGDAAIIPGQISKDKNDKNSISAKKTGNIIMAENQISNDKNAPGSNELKNTTDNNQSNQKNKSFTANKNKDNNKYTYNHSGKRNNTKKSISENENVYNSSASASKQTAQNTSERPAEKTKQSAVAAAKSSTPKLTFNKNSEEAAKQKTHPYFPRFELGVKAGYETGFNNDAAKKAAVSPYLQYNLTPKWSIMLQPSVKSSFLSSRVIGSPQSYYKVNNDGKVAIYDSLPVVIPEGSGFDTALWHRFYTYSQSHDSIVKTSVIGGTYMEFEIPVLLKYQLSKKFSVYGGVNIVYSKLINISEKTSTSKPINRTAIKDTFSNYSAPAPTMPPVNEVITYSGTPISSYTGPQYPSAQSSLFRCGYMLGFSYQYDKRWLFDALVQQASVPANVQAGYNINSALSSAYLRLTIGYKLTK